MLIPACITVQNIERQRLIQSKQMVCWVWFNFTTFSINKARNRRVQWKLSSHESHCFPRLTPRSTVEFSGWHFPMYPSIAGIIYILFSLWKWGGCIPNGISLWPLSAEHCDTFYSSQCYRQCLLLTVIVMSDFICYSAADTAWSLLQRYLRIHEENTLLHRTVVIRLLSQGFPLPSWLVKSYKVKFTIKFL
jgi:hypothetical protein